MIYYAQSKTGYVFAEYQNENLLKIFLDKIHLDEDRRYEHIAQKKIRVTVTIEDVAE